MTWKLTAYAKTRMNLPGVQWRDLSDDEYAAAVEANPGMEDKGYFEKEPEEESTPPPSSSRTRKAVEEKPND